MHEGSMHEEPTRQGRTHESPGSLLLHPVMVGCLLLLVVNDHALKARFHNSATGKLSDVVGLALFPVLVVALVEVGCWMLGRQGPARHQLLVIAAIGTAIGFTAVQTLPWATDVYRSLAGIPWSGQSSVVADVGDLMALPAVAVGVYLDRRRPFRRFRRSRS